MTSKPDLVCQSSVYLRLEVRGIELQTLLEISRVAVSDCQERYLADRSPACTDYVRGGELKSGDSTPLSDSLGIRAQIQPIRYYLR